MSRLFILNNNNAIYYYGRFSRDGPYRIVYHILRSSPPVIRSVLLDRFDRRRRTLAMKVVRDRRIIGLLLICCFYRPCRFVGPCASVVIVRCCILVSNIVVFFFFFFGHDVSIKLYERNHKRFFNITYGFIASRCTHSCIDNRI